jgi:hypothetical protein
MGSPGQVVTGGIGIGGISMFTVIVAEVGQHPSSNPSTVYVWVEPVLIVGFGQSVQLKPVSGDQLMSI